jgi:AbrB family looped-hinge helix DNA binding protein
MREASSRVTTKGQVTIPVEIRRLLRVAPHDEVTFVVDGEQVQLKRKESIVARTAGALRGPSSGLTDEQQREATEQAIARESVRRMDE